MLFNICARMPKTLLTQKLQLVELAQAGKGIRVAAHAGVKIPSP
jgi:hypothetical protein